jgi:sn-glycerol 3-phosphate transport system substrate-binding protein
MSRFVKRSSGVLAAVVLAVTGLTLGGGEAGAAPAQASGSCSLNALKNAKTKPVEITYWHSMNRANEESLQRLTDKFNSSQSDVHVTLVNQSTYEDTFNKFRAGLSSGDLPDLVQIQDISLQAMIDSQAVLPAQACVKADKYDLSDTIKRVTDYYTVKGTLWPVPFNVSNPLFFYNKKAFQKAGLDPNQPPQTLDDIKADAKKLQDSGAVSQAGMGLKLDPWHLEQWSAIAGKTYVNNGNGRKGRASAVTFDNATGTQIFTFLDDMVTQGLAKTNPYQGGDQYNNLLGIGNGNFGMTIDSSATLGTISQVISQYPDVELGVAPMPGAKGRGGVLVGGAANYIMKKSSPEKQAAAWEFAKFLDQPEQQAQWAADTGYVPISKAAVTLGPIQQLWAQNPEYKVAYDQLTTGVNNTATAGPVIGDYQGVRDVVLDAEQMMFTQGKSPKAALKDAKSKSDQVIGDYNSRVAG